MNKSITQYFDREDRNNILFVLGVIASLGSVIVYLQLTPLEFWYSAPQIASGVPVALLAGGVFTSVYFYRRSLPE